MPKRPFEELARLDRVVHEPARLAILTALEACEAASFTFLESLTGLTSGNLNTHLTRLKEERLIAIEKAFRGNVPETSVQITPAGIEAVRQHWNQLRKLRRDADRWRPAKDSSTEDAT